MCLNVDGHSNATEPWLPLQYMHHSNLKNISCAAFHIQVIELTELGENPMQQVCCSFIWPEVPAQVTNSIRNNVIQSEIVFFFFGTEKEKKNKQTKQIKHE
jgi:hypothetical protein